MEIRLTDAQLAMFLASESAVTIQAATLAVSMIQGHFEQQGFDGKPWVERYPNQTADKINVAGTISDFNEGNKQPKSRRFQDRPVLGGPSSEFGRATTYRITGDNAAEIGIAGEIGRRAAVHHEGGRTEQRINADAKKALRRFLTANEKYIPAFARVIVRTGSPAEKAFQVGSFDIADSLETQVNERPFFALSRNESADIVKEIAAAIQRVAGRGDTNG